MADTVTIPTTAEVEALLYREARLLDEVRYEQWLELFTDDGLYWLPVGDDEEAGTADPARNVQIIFDDPQRREERIWRTLNTPVLDQNPRSRTIHMVMNVEVEPEPVDGEILARCVQQVAELRPGGLKQIGLNHQRTFTARCEYRLRDVDGDLRIRMKKVLLLDRDLPIFNLTFIF